MGTNMVSFHTFLTRIISDPLLQLTSSSRQTFAFSRDGNIFVLGETTATHCLLGALPFSKYLYYIDPSKGVPTRCVCFGVTGAVLIGLIALAGPAAAGAIFSMAVVGQYVCNATVIATRWIGGKEFKHGPFNLGFMVSNQNFHPSRA
jgi:amino acid transporter